MSKGRKNSSSELTVISSQHSSKLLKDYNTQLKSDIEITRMVITTSCEIVKVMTQFYQEAFREIADNFGFDLTKLKSIREVLADS